MKGTVFLNQSVAIKLRQHESTPAQQIPQQKIGECAGVGLEPTTLCMQGRRQNHEYKSVFTCSCTECNCISSIDI